MYLAFLILPNGNINGNYGELIIRADSLQEATLLAEAFFSVPEGCTLHVQEVPFKDNIYHVI